MMKTADSSDRLLKMIICKGGEGMKQRRKNLLSKALVSVLCCGMVASNLNIAALAAGNDEAVVRAVSESDVVKIGDTGYATLAEAVENAAQGDTLVVLNDMDVKEPVVISKKLTLTAESPVVITKATTNLTLDKGCMFYVQGGGELTLEGALTIQGTEKGSSMIYVYGTKDAAVLNMEEGVTLTGNVLTNSGATAEGGAVTVKGNSTFNMNGGTIRDCGNAGSRSESNLTGNGAGLGGAVTVDGSAASYETVFNMNGGTITRCYAQYGGAVGVYTRNEGRAVVNVNDGAVTANCAGIRYSEEAASGLGEGGAFFVCAYTDNDSIQVNVNGGSVTENVALKKTMGMLSRVNGIKLGGHYNILGGTISGNKAGTSADQSAANAWGQGVFAGSEGLVTIGGNADIQDEVYLNDCTVNVRNDFTGTAKLYLPGAAQDDAVAAAVDENGEPVNAEASIRGTLMLVERTSDGTEAEDLMFMLIPSDTGFILNARNMACRELLKVIGMIESLDEAAYMPDTWKALEEVLAEAKAVASDPSASQAEADAALIKLLAAFDALEPAANKVSLEEAIKSAEAVLTSESINNYDTQELSEAVVEGKAVMNDPGASQEEVDAAASKILDKLAELAKKADVRSLEALIKSAKNLLDGNYTGESLEDLQAAVEAAEAVLNDSDRADDALGEAYGNLIDAIVHLQAKGNKAALKAILEKANAVLADSGKYVAVTIEGLETVKNAAQKVYDNEAAQQKEIDQVVRELTLEVAKARLLGDVNGDGRITTTDSVEILRAAAEINELSDVEAASADVNGDGTADTSDAVLVLQFAAEKITEF